MSVVGIKELFQRRKSSYRSGKYTHTRVFQVRTSDIQDGPAVALTAEIKDEEGNVTAHVPAAGELYPGALTLRVTSKDAQPVQEHDKLFEVTCEYSQPQGSTSTPTEGSPLDAPAEITWGSSESTEPYFQDTRGKALVNSAGEPFEQFLERERGELTCTIVRNEATFDPTVIDRYSHTINSNNVIIDGFTFPPATLKLSPPNAVKQTAVINGVETPYYRVTYSVKAREKGWLDCPLDVGTNEYIPDPDASKPGKLKPITDAAGLPVKKPWPLDGNGRKKPKPTDQPAVLEFFPYALKDWTDLHFS